MSLVVILMIGGWSATVLMIGVCALNEAGKLRTIRRCVALWLLETSAAASVIEPGEGLQPERENIA
jgi:hypothetical protein